MKYIHLLILLILGNTLSIAQYEKKDSFWGQIGYGISFAKYSNSDVGLNILGSINYETQNNNFSFSYVNSGEIALFKDPGEYIKSYELKYGRSIDFSMRGLLFPFPFLLIIKKDFNYSLVGKIGISYNEGLKRTTLIQDDFFDDSYNSKIVSGFGLPVGIEMREEITRYIGMGLSFYTNFNKVKNYSSFNFSLYVGQF
ncbi:MAG: hypothetical protein WCS69_10520 [Ignavibacteriaceae bacterium]|jgi:hypothetical protein